MRKVLLVLLVGVLALGAAACSGGDDDESGASADYGVAEAEEPMDAAVSDDGGEAAGGGSGEDAVAVAQETAVPSVRPRVIQTAALSLSVPRNEFDKVVDQARLLANSTGGFGDGEKTNRKSLPGQSRLRDRPQRTRVFGPAAIQASWPKCPWT